MYLAGIVAVVLLSVLWNVFIHPLRTAAAVIKFVLGLAGVVYFLTGLVTGDFGSGFIGVVLLIGASMVSFFQERRA